MIAIARQKGAACGMAARSLDDAGRIFDAHLLRSHSQMLKLLFACSRVPARVRHELIDSCPFAAHLRRWRRV